MKFQSTLRNLFTALFALSFFTACKKDKSVTQPAPTVMVSTYAGDGNFGFVNGPALTASFAQPKSLAIDAIGNVYVIDHFVIRKISATGMVTTLAGDGTEGFADGPGATAKFNYPSGIAVDAHGNVFVADQGNSRIRKITPTGMVSTFAGNGTVGFADGTGSTAKFNNTYGVAVDANGNVFVADRGNYSIRKISPAGMVSTMAGNGTFGYADGVGSEARFRDFGGVAVDANGNIFVSEFFSSRIRKINPAGMVNTFAGNGTKGFADGDGTAAIFGCPNGVAVDAHGNVFVADECNYRIRKITIQ